MNFIFMYCVDFCYMYSVALNADYKALYVCFKSLSVLKGTFGDILVILSPASENHFCSRMWVKLHLGKGQAMAEGI